MPQRQRIVGNAAVVEDRKEDDAVRKASRGSTAEKAIPQRQRNAGNAAVVEEGEKGNAVRKASRGSTAEKAIPQRQGNAGNAAVVEVRRRDCGGGDAGDGLPGAIKKFKKTTKNFRSYGNFDYICGKVDSERYEAETYS